MSNQTADFIAYNGKIATQNEQRSIVEAVAVLDGKFLAAIVGGKPVYAAEEFETLAPAPPPVLPDWSPVAHFGGYAKPAPSPVHAFSEVRRAHSHEHSECLGTGGFGCLCWAF
jgi:hypothetical protein